MSYSKTDESKATSIPNRIKRLGESLIKDISLVYKKSGIEIDPNLFAICRYLNEKGSAPINEIASVMELTHPAIIGLVNQMVENGMVETSIGVKDRRKRMVSLTEKGKKDYQSVLPLYNDIEESIQDLSKSTGFDIPRCVDSLEKAVRSGSFNKLVMEKNKNRLIESVEILRYSPHYKDDFLQLNYEWLNKYFTVEEEDKRILSNPEEVIINKGGEIFFARVADEIVGTCAAIKIDNNTYELAKMAVTQKAQGKQAGKKLALSVIGFAYSKGAKAVILETNSSLHSAISLYESIGFKNIPGSFDSKYSRSTFRMKLELK